MTPTTSATRRRAWTPLSAYLEFEGEGPIVGRTIDDTWTFMGRVFGGYSAALLAAATLERSPLPTLLSASVTFLVPLEPGEVEIEVEAMYAGRSAWAGRAVLSQAGRPALFGDVWCGAEGALPAVAGAPEPPADAAPIDWFLETYPFMTAFEERGIDYPADPGADPDPVPRVTLAARPVDALEVASERELQLFALMLTDAHLLDAALRPHGMTRTLGVSHNLTVHWTAMPEPSGWLDFAVEAVGEEPFAATRGELRGAGGAPVAWCLQQGRVRQLAGEGEG